MPFYFIIICIDFFIYEYVVFPSIKPILIALSCGNIITGLIEQFYIEVFFSQRQCCQKVQTLKNMEIHKILLQLAPTFLFVFTLAQHNQHHVSGMSPNLLECSRHSKPKQWRAISCSLNKCVCRWSWSDGRRGSWHNAAVVCDVRWCWRSWQRPVQNPATIALLQNFFFIKKPKKTKQLLSLLIVSHEKGGRRWHSGCSDLSPSGPLRMPPWTVLCSQAL